MDQNKRFDRHFTLESDTDSEYTPQSGSGFVTEHTAGGELWRLPEINNGFTAYPSAAGRGNLTYFRTDVPNAGNYTVKISLSCPDPQADVIVFSERRRCVLCHAHPGPDGRIHLAFTANVCPIIPRGKETVYSDGAADVTIAGAALKELSIREAPEIPTVFILGDSTVTDQPADLPYDPASCYCGWGQMLPAFFQEGAAVSNHAHSGLTTASFRNEGHWDIVSGSLRPGDYVMMQFGHNDQKRKDLAAYGGYAKNLTRYIEEIRAKGAVPILITPVSRSLWNAPGGQFNDLLKDWADACRTVAEKTETPLIDLHEQSMRFILEHGQEGSKPFFHPDDYTHFNDFGGYLMADFVVQGLRKTGLQDLRACLRSADVMPAPSVPQGQAEAPKGRNFFSGPKVPAQKPAGVDSCLLRAGVSVSRAEFLSAACSTFLYLPKNVYNDVYPDVFGDEWYAGTVQGAYDSGLTGTPAGKNFRPAEPVSCADALAVLIRILQDRYQAPKTEDLGPETGENKIHKEAGRLGIDFQTPDGKLDGAQAEAMLKKAAAAASKRSC